MTSQDRLTRFFMPFPSNHDICTIVQMTKTGQQQIIGPHREERLEKQ
jgi:hypothetical protein